MRLSDIKGKLRRLEILSGKGRADPKVLGRALELYDLTGNLPEDRLHVAFIEFTLAMREWQRLVLLCVDDDDIRMVAATEKLLRQHMRYQQMLVAAGLQRYPSGLLCTLPQLDDAEWQAYCERSDAQEPERRRARAEAKTEVRATSPIS